MFHYTKGNIISADVEALVNTVNTVGVMGKGIALAFKKAFPENFNLYKLACDNQEVQLGELFVTKTGQIRPKFIINFPTKDHWRNKSKIKSIELGLIKLSKLIEDEKISSIAIPPLGCGNGGLSWTAVKPMIYGHLKDVSKNAKIIIYEPGYNNQIVKPKKEMKLTPARAMLMSSLNNYQSLGYSINLLVAQKMAYFLQRLGEPLNLEYEKGYYGPYSHKLQHLLKYLNGHFLQFNHEETKPSTTVYIKNFQIIEQFSEQGLDEAQKDRLNKLQDLIEGFESPYGLELLATVDFIRQNVLIPDSAEIINKIGHWTKRKKEIMKPFHITTAFNRLNDFYLKEYL